MTFKRLPAREVKQYEGKSPGAPRRCLAENLNETLIALQTLDSSTTLAPSRKIARDPALTLGNKIRESARGEACTVRLRAVCTFDPAKTIWSHARWGAQLGEAGRGMGTKALDVCGAYACTACDAVFDGQIRARHLLRDEIDLAWMMGHLRSLGRLHEKGLL